MTKVLAVEQQKGGVGKSDVSKNLAGALQAHGRVLLIDWDPQGDLTRMLKLDWPKPGKTLAAALLGQWEPSDPVEIAALHSSGVYVIPNSLDMHTLEPQLYQVRARENRLGQFVSWVVDSGWYDYILIDCPPALGLLGDNASVATSRGGPGSGVLVVAAPWPIIFGNLELLHLQLAAVRSELGVAAPVVGMVVNMYDERKGNMETRSHASLTQHPDYLTTIRMRAVISEAAAAGQTVEQYARTHEAAGWYRDLAKVVA